MIGKENGQEWLRRWDQMQTNYLPEREKRFQVMLDVLDVLFPGSFVAVDLACGPGSLSQRLLTRFPRANCVAVDIDPVLLALGRSVLGEMQGRLHWSELDIREPGWHTRLGETQVDAVLSTTALHWLPPETLVSDIYQPSVRLLRPCGNDVRHRRLDKAKERTGDNGGMLCKVNLACRTSLQSENAVLFGELLTSKSWSSLCTKLHCNRQGFTKWESSGRIWITGC